VALIVYTEGHKFGIELEYGEWGPPYITCKLLDAEQTVIDARTWTHAGVSPRVEGIPPDWEDDDPRST